MWRKAKMWGQSMGHFFCFHFYYYPLIARKHILYILNINCSFLLLREIILITCLCWRLLDGVLDENHGKENVKVVKSWGFLSVFLLNLRVHIARVTFKIYLDYHIWLFLEPTLIAMHITHRVLLFFQMDPYCLLQITLQS